MTAKTFGALSPAQQRIINPMREMGFGKIRRLSIINGEPDLKGALVTTRKKLTKPESVSQITSDFELSAEHFELFRTIREIQNGIIACLEVQHGLPCHLETEAEVH